jgi:hypothetical protein
MKKPVEKEIKGVKKAADYAQAKPVAKRDMAKAMKATSKMKGCK